MRKSFGLGGIGNLGGKNQMGCYAHFPGSGPDGKTCNDCGFFKVGKSIGDFVQNGKCLKWQEVAQSKKGPEPIKPVPSCKYFEEKK